MKFTLITVGKIKEKYWKDAIAEYSKRLSSYGSLQILEVSDEKTPDAPSVHEKELILQKEAERLQKLIDPNGYLVTLEIGGKKLDSVGFARTIEQLGVKGVSHIQFVIGGSLGLSFEISKQSDLKLSFSDFTFPHQMMRVILLEQIYRACRINRNEPYHK